MGLAGTAYFTPPSSMLSILEEDKVSRTLPATRLACTLGPNSRDVPILEDMLKAGMSIARFDFTWGSQEYHQETLDNLRAAMARTGRMCAVMLDTMGPEIIVLNRPTEPITLTAGQQLVLTCNKSVQASASVLPISYPSLADTGLQPGASVFVGQYLFTGSETSSAYLTVKEVRGDDMLCVVNNSCVLEGLLLTVHMAEIDNRAPILSAVDLDAIAKWGVKNNIEFLSLSFTRCAADVHACRAVLDRAGLSHTNIFVKIENKEGMVNYREILEAADAVVFSRGNLGVCLEAEKMFLAQKMLLQECNLGGKPVYVTRVVDTLTEAPRPTRAEATDVANLVLDGADGILLGSETFRGKYPVECVQTVSAICRQAEACFNSDAYYRYIMKSLGAYSVSPNMSKHEALASSAVRAAAKLNAALIVVFTVTGRTARIIAKYRPSQPILTVVVPKLTSNGLHWLWTGDAQARQCLQYRGVLPIMADPTIGNPDGAILQQAFEYARSLGIIKTGDRVVVSQCPRTTGSDIMQEAGVVKIVQVDDVPSGATTSVLCTDIGSVENLVALE